MNDGKCTGSFKGVERANTRPFRRLSRGIVGVWLCAGKRVWIQANVRASTLIYPEAEVNDDVPLCLVFFSL